MKTKDDMQLKIKIIKDRAPFLIGEEYTVFQHQAVKRWWQVEDGPRRGMHIPKVITDHKR